MTKNIQDTRQFSKETLSSIAREYRVDRRTLVKMVQSVIDVEKLRFEKRRLLTINEVELIKWWLG